MRFSSGMTLSSGLLKCLVCMTLCNLNTGHAYPRPQHSSLSSSPTGVVNRDERSTGTSEYNTDAVKYTLKTQVEMCDVFCFNGSKHYLPLRCRGPRIVTCGHCSCDDTCAIYGDCCPDKDGVVPPFTSTMTFSCVGGHGLAFTTGTPYLMIHTCPGDSSIPEELSPVTSTLTNITYVNQAAAVCNNDLDFVRWESERHCGSWGYCDNQFKPTPEDVHHHPCNWQRTHVDQTIIDACNVSGSVPSYTQGLDELCQSSKYPVYHGITAYTNIFCYLCNVVDGVTSIGDCSEGWDTFLGKPEKKLKCPDDTWADPVSEQCRETHCMSGLKLKNGTCIIDPARPYSLYLLMLTFDLSKVPGLETWEEVVQLFRDGVQGNLAQFRPFAYYFAIESLDESSSTSKEVHLSVELWSGKDNTTTSITDIFYAVWRKWRFLHRGRVFYLNPKPYDFYKTGMDTREFMFDPINNTCCLETDYDTFFDYLYAETDIFDGRDEIHTEFDFNGPPCPYVIPTDEEIELFANGSIRIMADGVTLGRGDYFRLYEEEVQICISTLQAAYDRVSINAGDNSWNSADNSVKETTTLGVEFKESFSESVNETFNNTDPDYSIENNNGKVNKTLNTGSRYIGYLNVTGTDISNNETMDYTRENVDFNVSKISNVMYVNIQKTSNDTDTAYSNKNKNNNVNITSNNRDLISKKTINDNYTLNNEKPDNSSENVNTTIGKTSSNTNHECSSENKSVKVNNTLIDTDAGYSEDKVNSNVRTTPSNTDPEYSKENVTVNVSNTSNITSNNYGENVNFHIGLTSHSTDNKYSSKNENVKNNKTLNNTDIEYSSMTFIINETSSKIDNNYSSKNGNFNTSNNTDIESHKTNVNINVDNIENNTYIKLTNDNDNISWSSNKTDSEYSHENWNLTIALNDASDNVNTNTNTNITLNNMGPFTGENVTLDVNMTLNGKEYLHPNIENMDGMFNINMTLNKTTIHSDFNIDYNQNATLKNGGSRDSEDVIGDMNKTLNNRDNEVSNKNLRGNDENILNITDTPPSEHLNPSMKLSLNSTYLQYFNEHDNMTVNNTKSELNRNLTLHVNSTLTINDAEDTVENLDVVSTVTRNGTNVDHIDNLLGNDNMTLYITDTEDGNDNMTLYTTDTEDGNDNMTLYTTDTEDGNDNMTLYITDTEDAPSDREHNNTEILTQHSSYVNLTKSGKNVTSNRTGNMDSNAEVGSGSVGSSFRALVFTIMGTCWMTLQCSCLY